MIITADTKVQTSYADAEWEVLNAIHEDTIIPDATAVTIAAAWQSPCNALSTLASTGKVNAARLRDDVDREIRALDVTAEDYTQELTMLTALQDWRAAKERG